MQGTIYFLGICGSGVHTVHILQGLQGFVLIFDFIIYLDHIFQRHFASVHINTK